MFWDKAGPKNTDDTIKLALQRATELDINHMVIASCTGDSAKKLLSYNSGRDIVCVTHHSGFASPGENEMDTSVRKDLMVQGVQVLTTTHFFAGADRALRLQFGGVYPAEIMAQTLRILGQGIKVAVEISIMALDAGLIPFGREIIALGGTAEGVDTAIVVVPAHSRNFFDTQVREIICMPREKKR
ncbi:MAG: pyruvate kinase alpha/beta domain-containing protein [Deltaproteobacteria bacterium]